MGERAHFTAINLYDVPLKIAPNGHLLLRIDSWLNDAGFPREPEAWKFTPSDIIIPEPQWIPEEPASVSGEALLKPIPNLCSFHVPRFVRLPV